MNHWTSLFVNKGDSIALIAAAYLAIEALVDMAGRSAIMYRAVPAMIGVWGSYVLYENNKLLAAALYLASATLALAARLARRDYWDTKSRMAINFLPIVSFCIAAGVMKFM